MKKIKIMSANRSEYTATVNKLLALGAVSRDGNTSYNSDKPGVAVYFKDYEAPYLVCSRLTYKPKNKYDNVLSVSDVLSMNSLNQLLPETACNQVSIDECASLVEAADEAGYAEGYDDGLDAAPLIPSNMVVKDITVATMNPIVYRAQGIAFLEAAGLNLTEDDGKQYVLDLEANSAVEVTAETASAQAAKDFLEGEDTAYTAFAQAFNLITNLQLVPKPKA